MALAVWGPLPAVLGPGARARVRDMAGAEGSAALSFAASMNVALYAGIAGGVLAVLILIGVLVYCCCCREKSEAEDARP